LSGGDVGWLRADPIFGTVPAYSSTPVQVAFDATVVEPDTYTTQIVVRSNDPVAPSVSVPVTMTVLPTVVIAVDIKPRACPNPLNVKSRGKLPVAILGTDGFDVEQIDPASVRLAGVAPLRWALEDVATPYESFTGKQDAHDCTRDGPDGYLDLTLKFETQELVAALGEVDDGEVRVLQLTGNLKEAYGGTPIVGEDVVIILKKGKK
jgi:hypothetical protein